jgi:hypothetical protein
MDHLGKISSFGREMLTEDYWQKCLAGQCSEVIHKLKGMPLKKLDSILLYRLLTLLLPITCGRGFFVQEINGYCVNRCRQGDQPTGG